MKQYRQSGHTLLVVMMAVVVVSTVVGIAVMSTSQITRNAQRTRLRDGAIAVGDAYLEWAFAQWRSTCQTQRNTALPTISFANLTSPPANLIPDSDRFTITNFTISALDPDGEPQDASGNRGNPPAGIKAEGGEDDMSYYYLAQADVTVSALGGPDITVRVRRVFEKLMESPWKYAIAYLAANRPALELHPGPVFTVEGPVHGNGPLYISPDGGKLLTFLDKVTSVEDYFQGYMDADWKWRGRLSADGAPPTFAPDMPWASDTRKDPFGITPSQFDPTDSNQDNDSYRELLERPADAANDPLTDQSGSNPRFYNSASVRVTVNANNNVTILNTAGIPVTATSPSSADRMLNDAIRPAITTGVTIQDNRENSSVRLTTLDVSKIKANQVPAWNGVIYISDTSASQNQTGANRGVRIKNGSTLPTGGLTVVSDNPIYIQGDYNTGSTRQPSAVIGDAVMILSNNWKDANSSLDLNSRKATDTTVNTAILSGIVPTNSAYPGKQAYSGGVENFPRFLENWTGRTFTYKGSMVQLFHSMQATGRWGKGNVYDAPNRNWSFDVNFRTNPPPGTLFTTTYKKQRWYLE